MGQPAGRATSGGPPRGGHGHGRRCYLVEGEEEMLCREIGKGTGTEAEPDAAAGAGGRAGGRATFRGRATCGAFPPAPVTRSSATRGDDDPTDRGEEGDAAPG